MKKLILSIALLFSLAIAANCQFKIMMNDSAGSLPKTIGDYKRATRSDMGVTAKQFALNIMEVDSYNEKLEKITQDEMMALLQSGDYTITPYIDEEAKVKAIVFVKATEAQKQKAAKKMGSKTISSMQSSQLLDKPFPLLELTDIKGNRYSIEKLKGKVVVINTWFIDCKPCRYEMPDLNKLVEKYKDKEIVFLGLALDKKEDLEKFMKENKFLYNVVDNCEPIITPLGINGFPTHIVIDKKGIVKYTVSGLSDNTIEQLEASILAQLKA